MINDKRSIREEVNRIITAYEGEDMYQLLQVIKDNIEKRMKDGDKEV